MDRRICGFKRPSIYLYLIILQLESSNKIWSKFKKITTHQIKKNKYSLFPSNENLYIIDIHSLPGGLSDGRDALAMGGIPSAVTKPALFNRLAQVMQAEGLQGILKRAEERRKYLFSFSLHFLVACFLDQDCSLVEIPEFLKIEQVQPEDIHTIQELLQIYGSPMREGILQMRFQDHYLGYVARVDGQLIGYVWVHLTDQVKEYRQTIIHLRPDEIYFLDAYIIPKMRGRGFYPAMKAFVAREMIQKFGKTKAVSYIELTNRASLRASSKLKGCCIGWIGYLKLLGRRYPFELRHWPIPLKILI
jgi:hypothetical protein